MLLTLSLIGWGSLGLADDSAAALKSLQGKWSRMVRTPDGPAKMVKEHAGNITLVTAYDEKGNVLYGHKSEFKIDTTGKIPVLTFTNRTITAGPNAGQINKEATSFAFRVAKDQFIEAYGLLENDPSEPLLIVWKREKPEGPPKID